MWILESISNRISPENAALRLRITHFWVDELWSAGQIAAEVGISRSAVIGHIHRMKLPKREEKTNRKLQKRLPSDRMLQQKSKPLPIPALIETDITPLHISMMELTRGMCNWPYGDAEYTFCGLKADGLYCDAHKRKAFQPGTQPRRHRDKMRSDRQFGF